MHGEMWMFFENARAITTTKKTYLALKYFGGCIHMSTHVTYGYDISVH